MRFVVKLSLVLLVCCVASFLVCLVGADSPAVSGTDLDMYFPQGYSLMFQVDAVDYGFVAVEPVVGNLNCTDSEVSYYGVDSEFGGVVLFNPVETCNVSITYGNAQISPTVNAKTFDSGEEFEFVGGGSYTLAWASFMVGYTALVMDVGIKAVVVVVCLFAPAVGLVILTKSGIFGFIAGLTAGAVLSYFFLPAVGMFAAPDLVWVVFAVVVVDAFVFVSAMRKG